jgi:prepilin-type N-terminal cleavage/methylation domain-containing protein
MKIRCSTSRAFTLVELSIVVVLISILAAIAVPQFVKSRASSQANSCIMNLKILSAGLEVYSRENKLLTGTSVALTNLLPFVGMGTKNILPTCPAGGTYAVDYVQNPPTCTISGHVLP